MKKPALHPCSPRARQLRHEDRGAAPHHFEHQRFHPADEGGVLHRAHLLPAAGGQNVKILNGTERHYVSSNVERELG